MWLDERPRAVRGIDTVVRSAREGVVVSLSFGGDDVLVLGLSACVRHGPRHFPTPRLRLKRNEGVKRGFHCDMSQRKRQVTHRPVGGPFAIPEHLELLLELGGVHERSRAVAHVGDKTGLVAHGRGVPVDRPRVPHCGVDVVSGGSRGTQRMAKHPTHNRARSTSASAGCARCATPMVARPGGMHE